MPLSALILCQNEAFQQQLRLEINLFASELLFNKHALRVVKNLRIQYWRLCVWTSAERAAIAISARSPKGEFQRFVFLQPAWAAEMLTAGTLLAGLQN